MAGSLDRLKSQLLASGVQQQNFALYQVINQLIESLRGNIDAVASITGTGGGSSSLATRSYVTTEDEQLGLPFARQIVPGTGIGFNNDGKRLIINAHIPPVINGEDGEPGPIGPQGLQGPSGLNGQTIWMPPDIGDYEPEIPTPLGNILISPTDIIEIAYDSGNFTANGSMTWTVAVGDFITSYFTKLNKEFVLWFTTLTATTVGGTPNTTLRIAIPPGITVTREASSVNVYSFDQATNTIIPALMIVRAGQSYMEIWNQNLAANWPATTGLEVYFSFLFPAR